GPAWWCDVGKIDKGCGIGSLGWCSEPMDLDVGEGRVLVLG
ncbi:hypothetical protein A2U01_0037472, partial [Trifolium medium]|nr:hypothetical protein [Trifolium medium]